MDALPAEVREQYDELLFTLRWCCGFRDAVIAGGAVRDVLLGRPVKDIDVWYSDDSHVDWVEVSRCFPTWKRLLHDDAAAYISGGEVQAVIDLDSFSGGKPVQLIRTWQSGRSVLDRFDIGLCQVGYDGRVFHTADFLRDVERETITILRSPKGGNVTAHMSNHLDRVQAKYPTFTPVSRTLPFPPPKEPQ